MFRAVIFTLFSWFAVAHADGVHVVKTSGPSNAGFIVGERGVAVIDSGSSYREGKRIIAEVERVTRQPIRVVILTYPGEAAIFGAEAFRERGIPILMQRDAAGLVAARCDSCLQRLVARLGEAAMEGTRVVAPDRIVDGDTMLDLIGRPLRILAPPRSSAPGALAVLDVRSGTLFAGSIVSIDTVPDTRDADAKGWRAALAILAATRCRHLIPAFGPAARCADIAEFARYFSDLDAHVERLVRDGVGLAELGARADLPEYAGWQGYDSVHRANASRAYLRHERALFGLP